MRAVWRGLVNKFPELDEQLYEHAEPTPAMLTLLARESLATFPPTEDVAAFADELARTELNV